jgi:hypothetical protein
LQVELTIFICEATKNRIINETEQKKQTTQNKKQKKDHTNKQKKQPKQDRKGKKQKERKQHNKQTDIKQAKYDAKHCLVPVSCIYVNGINLIDSISMATSNRNNGIHIKVKQGMNTQTTV